ncbi:MAG: NADP-dependent malic enzyme, partial [Candidatus Cloacimonetes bacterium]|nr:NADP-dependent malic enzyme [Candidatus Cloacimonadota bacterium]
PPHKAEFARDTPCRTLEEAIVGADMFLGLSVKGAVTPEMLRSMNRDPIVFALANPDPEISYPEAVASRDDVIMATGRSDYPNQVNNVLGFPFIFRGALDVRAREINEAMKVAAARAIANLAREDVPESVLKAYGDEALSFGRTYIIPKPFDPRVMLTVASAVARAAIESGVSRIQVDDVDAWEAQYVLELERRLGHHMELLRMVHQRASVQPAKLVYAEGENLRVLRAVKTVIAQGLAIPMLIGDPELIRERAASIDLDLSGIELVDPHRNRWNKELQGTLHELRNRKGMTLENALSELNHNEVLLGSMLVRSGVADGLVCGADKHYPKSLKPVMELLYEPGSATEPPLAAGIYLLIFKDRVLFLADCTVNADPSAAELAAIARGTARIARLFNIEPRVALLGFSNFGSVRHNRAVEKAREAVRLLHEQGTDFPVDGEMQADTALDREVLNGTFAFNRLNDEANVLVMPDLSSANIAYKLLLKLTDAVAVGPILLNNQHPVTIVQRNASVEDIVNLTAVTVIDAQEHNRRRAQSDDLRLPV